MCLIITFIALCQKQAQVPKYKLACLAEYSDVSGMLYSNKSINTIPDVSDQFAGKGADIS